MKSFAAHPRLSPWFSARNERSRRATGSMHVREPDAGTAEFWGQTPSTRVEWFASTHWSMVLTAVEGDLLAAETALGKLCSAYWKPLFVFARRLGHNEHDAQDLTQGFFEQFLEKGYIRAADPRRGRFRSFLLTSFRHFVRNEWAKRRASKRGGGVSFVSWEDLTPGEQVQLEPACELAPAAAFDQQWALRVFDLALNRLRGEFTQAGKADQFELLKPFLSRMGSGADYGRVTGRCGLSEGAVAVSVRRLRVRYGELLRAEIANTVASPEDIEDELQLLKRALTA
jgi:RNA polymerase sigma-70 factor (ECF subfamily)